MRQKVLKTNRRLARFSGLIHVLPFIHFSICVVIAVGQIEKGWEEMILIDFPFSVFLVALVWRLDYPLLWFGVLGTLWWYVLSWVAWFILIGRKLTGKTKPGGDGLPRPQP